MQFLQVLENHYFSFLIISYFCRVVYRLWVLQSTLRKVSTKPKCCNPMICSTFYFPYNIAEAIFLVNSLFYLFFIVSLHRFTY